MWRARGRSQYCCSTLTSGVWTVSQPLCVPAHANNTSPFLYLPLYFCPIPSADRGAEELDNFIQNWSESQIGRKERQVSVWISVTSKVVPLLIVWGQRPPGTGLPPKSLAQRETWTQISQGGRQLTVWNADLESDWNQVQIIQQINSARQWLLCAHS